MTLIVCKNCGLATDLSEIIHSKYRDYEAWCLECVESEAEEMFRRG